MSLEYQYVDPIESLNASKREALHAKAQPQAPSLPAISRRDYFAAAALQGLLGNDSNIYKPSVVDDARRYADQLLKALDEV